MLSGTISGLRPKARNAALSWPLLCAAIAFAVPFWGLLPARSLTFDEAYSAYAVMRPAREVFSFVAVHDAHPPLFYVALKAWTAIFGTSIAALRGFAAAGGAFMAYATCVLSLTLLPRRAAVAAGLVAAVAPLGIYAAAEVRMYPWLAALYALAAQQAWVHRHATGRGPLLGLSVVFATLAYVHYFGTLCVLAVVVQSALTGSRSGARRVFLSACLAALLFTPWLPNLVGQVTEGRANPPWRPGLPPTFPLEIVQVVTYGGGVFRTAGFYTLASASWAVQLLVTLPLLAFWALALRSLRRASPAALTMTAVAVSIPALALVVASLWTNSFVAYPRYFVFALPFLAMAVATYLIDTGASFRGTKIFRQLLLLLVVALSAASIKGFLSEPSRGAGNWQAAADYLAQRRTPREVVAVYPESAAIPFAVYIPGFERHSVAVPTSWHDPSAAAAANAIDALAAKYDVVWVVGNYPLPPGGFEATYHRLSRTHAVADFGDFDNVRVTRFARRPEHGPGSK